MTRILLQIVFALLPFMMFALYRIATAHKQSFSQRWPFAALTLIGLLLTSAFYVFMFIREPDLERACYAPSRLVDGKVVKGEQIPCNNASIDSREGKGLFGSGDDD